MTQTILSKTDIIHASTDEIPEGYRLHSMDEVNNECGNATACFAVRIDSLADKENMSVSGFYARLMRQYDSGRTLQKS